MSTTIACLSLAIPPQSPLSMDFVGNPIDVELISTVDTPDPITCEGFRTYVYEYTDCAGATHIWNYFYFLSSICLLSARRWGETVSCVNNINVNLVMPPAVNDNCGNPLTPVGPSAPVYNPPAFTWKAQLPYTWTYTDCDGK
ncbi:MAG: hypothetical protein IPN60_15810 [Saprospiraceae bacterium]|nr:hypothetical protein [Candidatus Opimibacter skivensis]